MVFILEKKTQLLAYILAALVVSGALTAAHGQSTEDLYREAIAAYERGQISQSILLYEQLVKLEPDSVPARTNLGVALAQVGRYREALTQYQEALKRDPRNAVVHLNLALAWYKQAEFEMAATELEKLREEHPDNQQSLYLLADCYLRLGRNSDAVVLLEPAYRIDADDRVVDYALGTALIRTGQIQRGEVVIDRILKDGNTAEANLLMGEAQFAVSDYKTAAFTLRKALDLNPNLPGAWSLYARALLDGEDKPGAKTAFQHALQADPNDFPANLYLGAILRRDGSNAEAAPYLERALQLRPASPEAQFQIAALHAANGRLDAARKEFEQIEKSWPDFLEVRVQLAALYSRMKLTEESQREREIVLKLNEKARQKSADAKP
jgi:tetratricopeptide (TPR) repeat protein